MTCRKIRRKLPGYFDGAVATGDHELVSEHLEFCVDCRRELERYRKLLQLIARVERAEPCAGLDVRIHVAVSQAQASPGWARRAWRVATLMVENILAPVAFPATGGIVTALLVFAVVFQSLLGGVPLGGVPNDVPVNFIQAPRLESLAPFTVSHAADGGWHTGLNFLLVEATLNAQGEVVNYQILSGRDSAAIRRQLDQVMLFSRFRPRVSFGRPTPGGRVILSFGEILVKG